MVSSKAAAQLAIAYASFAEAIAKEEGSYVMARRTLSLMEAQDQAGIELLKPHLFTQYLKPDQTT